jgi:hypothetical protein
MWKAKDKHGEVCRMDMESDSRKKCNAMDMDATTDKRSVQDGYLRQQWAAGSRMDAEGNRWDAVCKCIWKAAVGRSGQDGNRSNRWARI